jgi:hypothetical protein
LYDQVIESEIDRIIIKINFVKAKKKGIAKTKKFEECNCSRKTLSLLIIVNLGLLITA